MYEVGFEEVAVDEDVDLRGGEVKRGGSTGGSWRNRRAGGRDHDLEDDVLDVERGGGGEAARRREGMEGQREQGTKMDARTSRRAIFEFPQQQSFSPRF